MELNEVRSALTVLLLIVFVGIVIWAYARNNRQRFEDAAQLPFADEPSEGRAR